MAVGANAQIGLFHIAKIRLSKSGNACVLQLFSVYMAKAIRNLSVFNKKNLVFLIRNISSKELHSALGKISLVNLMYNLLGLKNYYGLKIQIQNFVLVFQAILGMAELDACVARFMKVIIRNLATRPDTENRLKKTETKFYI